MRVATWLSVLLTPAALVGCGKNGSEPPAPAARPQATTTTTGASPAKPAQTGPSFDRTANRLCADAGAKITALPPLGKGNFLSQVRYEQGLLRGLVAHLKPLRPPAVKRRGFERFLRDTAAQADIIDGVISALLGGGRARPACC